MSARRLAAVQPNYFSFNEKNIAWAKEQVAKYPIGRGASAIISLMWRAQEQHGGWLPEPAIRYVADFLSMPYIRAFEIATFYTMFHLSPVGRKAHIQVCTSLPCMLRGSDELIGVCKNRIVSEPDILSADSSFSWERVECLGACVNAPMMLIGSDTYEDLTVKKFNELLDHLEADNFPPPGPQNGRHSSEPLGGATTLTTLPAEEKIKRRNADAL
ncbi:MAG: NADH-quinone oxidoreductase subunit NuoE [Alphaproteobacteria bacterium]|nr:NADH-quinone oxidoreductase subunit NuoE [Alphaproteobacteria bacterium]